MDIDAARRTEDTTAAHVVIVVVIIRDTRGERQAGIHLRIDGEDGHKFTRAPSPGNRPCGGSGAPLVSLFPSHECSISPRGRREDHLLVSRGRHLDIAARGVVGTHTDFPELSCGRSVHHLQLQVEDLSVDIAVATAQSVEVEPQTEA